MTLEAVLLFAAVQGVLGTFPPVENPPPIPSYAVRNLDQPQQYYVQEGVVEEPLPIPNVRDGPLPPDNDQGWYIQERQMPDSESSRETFDRFYEGGEPAIGPVATPMPDENFLSQPSSLAKASTNDGLNPGPPSVWIVSRSVDGGQYVSDRWVQGPSDRVIEVVNEEQGPPVAGDIDRSYSVPLPQVQANSPVQLKSFAPNNVVQQIYVRKNSPVSAQKVFVSQPLVPEVPSAKQVVVDPAPPVYKQVVQQQVVKDAFPAPAPVYKQVVQQQVVKDAFPAPAPVYKQVVQQQVVKDAFPAPAPVAAKTQFVLPPPPPPPVKGDFRSSKVVSTSAVSPGPNVLVTDKSGSLLQQLRHIWVPTSARTGRFVSIPFTNGKQAGKGLPLDAATPLSVSDTWILKTDGLVPSFQQQKSVASPPVVQAGKAVVQDTAVVQVEPQQVFQVVDSPNYPTSVKSVDGKSGSIWPARNIDVPNAKVLDKSVVQSVAAFNSKSNTMLGGKSIVSPLPQQKSVTNNKVYSPPPQFNSPVFTIVDGKPCPISPQNPKGPVLVPPPNARFITTQVRPSLARIIRVNRYPSGSYYLLNTQVRPSIIAVPSPGVVQQSKSGIIVQNSKLPLPLQPIQSKQPIISAPKQISIPVQRIISPKSPQRLVIYTLPMQQTKSSVFYPKSTGRVLLPAVQRYGYLDQLAGYPQNSPIQFVKPFSNRISPLKAIKKAKKSSSSSSSESSSSEESKEEKKEEPKEEKSEDEEKPKEEEKAKESEEKEPAGDVVKVGGEESKVESESKEAAESRVYQSVHHYSR